ncbi:hypothetical protein [Vibrio sp. 10N.261.46.A3]|uniref:hypothetical protein n=1 Tax=Vibrio sp. 10N.261.46.A3 TaxID=3229658 RepID=UPI003550D2C4
MKKVMLMIALMSGAMASHTVLAKVTLEDGYASEAEYWDSVKQNRAEYEKDLYDGLEPPKSETTTDDPYLFGGSYGETISDRKKSCSSPNPITGNCSCPSGYDDVNHSNNGGSIISTCYKRVK